MQPTRSQKTRLTWNHIMNTPITDTVSDLDPQIYSLKIQLMGLMEQVKTTNKELEKHLTDLLKIANSTRSLNGLDSIDKLARLQSSLIIDSFKIQNELNQLAEKKRMGIVLTAQRYRNKQKNLLREIIDQNLLDVEWIKENVEITNNIEDYVSNYFLSRLYHNDHPDKSVMDQKRFTKLLKIVIDSTGWIPPRSESGNELVMKRIEGRSYRCTYGIKLKNYKPVW